MPAQDTTSLLQGILGVVQRTEVHIKQINQSLQQGAKKSGDSGVAAAAKGATGGGTTKSNKEVVNKLDIIIDLLKATVEDTGEHSSRLKSLGISISAIGGGLRKFGRASKHGPKFVSFLEDLEGPISKFGSKEVERGVKNLQGISMAIIGFSKNLLKAGMLLIPGTMMLPLLNLSIRFMARTFDYVGQKSKTISKGARVMRMMGVGMVALAGGIAILTLSMAASSMLLGKVGFPAGAIGVVAGVTLLFTLMGSSKRIRRGIRQLQYMGMGFMFLAGGIAILSLAFAASAKLMSGAKVGGMLGAGLGIISAVGGLAAMMFLLGLPPVRRGVRSMKAIGLGFLMLSAGIAIMGLTFASIGALFGISPIEVGGAIALSLIGLGAAFYGMGMAKKNILQGAIAVALMGVGLIPFAYALGMTMDALKGATWEDLGKLGTAIFGIASVVTGIGNPYTVWFTVAGAATLGAIGIGLAAVAKGMKNYMDLGAFKFDYKKFDATMKGFRDGFMVLLGDDEKGGSGVMGALRSLGTSFVDGSKLAMAVGNAVGIGAALSSMAKGVGAWANLQNIPLISGYDKEGMPIYTGENVNVDKAVDNILTFIGDGKEKGILVPFIRLSEAAGIQKSGGFSLMKLIVGTDASNTPFYSGLRSSVKIGEVLTALAEGVGTWANLQNIPLIDGYDKEGKPIYSGKMANVDKALDQIDTFIGDGKEKGILVPFIRLSEAAGVHKSGGFSLMKLFVGTDASNTPFYSGIRSAVKIGEVLTALAEGVGTWANLQNIPLIKGYTKEGHPIYEGKANVDQAMDQLTEFIGDGQKKGILALFTKFTDEKTGWSMARLISGNDASKTPMQRGISNALKIGRVLTSLGEGVGTWANLQNIPLITGYDKEGRATYSGYANVDKAIENVETALTMLTKVFLDIAGEPQESTGLAGWIGMTKNPQATSLSRAVRAIAPVGDLLQGLGTGIGIFANLQNIKLIDTYEWNEKAQRNVPIYSKESINVEGAIENAAYALQLLGDTLADVAGEPESSSAWGWLGYTTNKKATAISRAAKALAPVGDLLAGLAQGINTFANLENIKVIETYKWDEKAQINRPVYSKKSVDVRTAIDNAGYTIQLLGDTLADVAGTPEKSGGDAGWLGFTKNKKATAISRAAKALAPVGDLLGGLAESIKTFADLENIKIIETYEWKESAQRMVPVYSKKSVNVRSAIDNAGYAIEIMGEKLAEVGGVTANSEPGVLGWWKRYSKTRAISRAARALQPIGDLLGGLAEGMKTFANISNIKIIDGYEWKESAQRMVPIYSKKSVNAKQIAKNVVSVIEVLTNDLAGLVPDTPTGSIWNNWQEWRNYYMNSPQAKVRKAIAAISGIGEPLQGVAETIKTFADINNIIAIKGYDKEGKPIYGRPVNVTKIAKNVVKVVDVLTTGLAGLVPDVPKEGFKTWSEWRDYFMNSPQAKVRKAIAAISGIGEPLSGVADTIKTFADVENIISIKGYDKDGQPIYGDPVNVTKIAKNVVKVVDVLTTGLAELMPDVPQNMKAGELFSYILNSPNSKIRRAVGAISGIGETLSELAEGIKVFADLTAIPVITSYDKDGKAIYGEPTDVTSVADNIKSVLMTTYDVLDKIATKSKGKNYAGLTGVMAFEQFTDDLVKVARKANKFDKFTKSFLVMAAGMGKFTDEFKKLSPESIQGFTLWTKSLTDFVKLNTYEFAAKLQMIKKSLGDDNENVAEDMNEGPGGILNIYNKDKEEKDNLQKKKDQMMMLAIQSIKDELAVLNSNLTSVLMVKVQGTVSTKEVQ